MVSITQRRSVTIAIALATGLAIMGALAACTPTTEPSDAVSPSASASISPSESASASPDATATAAAPTPSASANSGAVAVTVACNALVSAQTMYNFNPNFTLVPGYTPAAGTGGAAAVAGKGVACGWVNNTSKDTLVVSAAKPGPAAITSAKASTSGGTPVSGLGDAAYFSTTAGAGRVDVFSGTTWVTATSTYFSSAADASPLVTSALAALK